MRGSKLLFADTKNELVLLDLKKLRKNEGKHEGKVSEAQSHLNNAPDRFFVSLDNNTATAITIGKHYYYAALDFDKTIVYYEFKGG